MRCFAFIVFMVAALFGSCTATPTSNAAPVDHSAWDKLLKKHVNDKGFVNYTAFKKDYDELKKYLNMLSESAPNDKWSKDEQLAYWINAYNAFTIQLILDNYPGITSIKDIGSKIKIPFVNTPWDVKFITIGGKKMDLNNIEHGIIRKKFDEPRIHFALVCAAKSCPPLRNEAFVADRLDKQLDEQGRDFINDKTKNSVSKDKADLSKILSWYGGDFTKKMPIADWVNKYSTVKLDKNASITHMDYDWALNGK
ncbi:DUF547 domain-containing protein [Runella slithyformis]|uniref:DUF547 domain-containing protein n=1 Tax=Runella slithyformis (strain ATCC 29530 / DSM 19594 / LMG 11500 / NCIMB 11436 / LSU 4) TaxID=761193 RepID=A0A7U4E579_RUNSL|nr:DUF547 domain-containing protein [Runella slithyformis]AEI47834.1 protein of unknown function DUF547 [Runella slithyformis DSM 19594]